jgi:hypothetical protein
VPARRQRSGKDEYISRPRFLAISEFGPRSLLYHEGARYRIEKVILPLRGDADVLATQSAKVCTHCGYLHEVGPADTMNVCDMCGTALPFAERRLFRMENVSTRRIDRINSDEEERSRFGYNVRTAIRFAERSGQRTERRAEIKAADGSGLARLAYGPAATLWRINQGWARKGKDSEPGFLLDIERGYWASNPRDEEDRDSPLGQRTVRVLPYVEDHRNALLFEPLSVPAGDDAQFMPTLQAALKNSILAVFQLEEDELAAEPLPSLEDRRKILLYESAEGGAGVLRRLVEEPEAVRQMARKALELLHFDPDTGDDRRHAPMAREDCEAACYGCLMTYTNQPDHRKLDRTVVRDVLMALRTCQVETAPSARSRREHLEWLSGQCGSELERKWLSFVFDNDLGLPTAAQTLVQECQTRPDFLYGDHQTAVYVDGPPHDNPDRVQRDASQTACMENRGYTVIRFGHHDDWTALVRRYPSVFGKLP